MIVWELAGGRETSDYNPVCQSHQLGRKAVALFPMHLTVLSHLHPTCKFIYQTPSSLTPTSYSLSSDHTGLFAILLKYTKWSRSSMRCLLLFHSHGVHVHHALTSVRVLVSVYLLSETLKINILPHSLYFLPWFSSLIVFAIFQLAMYLTCRYLSCFAMTVGI